VGYLAVSIGAGRVKKEDRIDPAAGITLDAKVGARVRRGDLLATLRLGEQHAARALELCDLLRSAYELAPLRTSWISAPTTLVLDHVP
jgi:thymidine phosphorylase